MPNSEDVVAALTGANKREIAKLEHDPIDNPAHYTNGSIEVTTFCEDQNLPAHEFLVVQYVCRARLKGEYIQDLKKAIWYLNRKIQLLEKERDYQS